MHGFQGCAASFDPWNSCPVCRHCDRQPSFLEVDLNIVRALSQTAANLGLVLVQQVVDEPLAGAGNSRRLGYIRPKAEGEMTAWSLARGRRGTVTSVTKRAALQPQHSASMRGRRTGS
jgi:hypothetical protein